MDIEKWLAIAIGLTAILKAITSSMKDISSFIKDIQDVRKTKPKQAIEKEKRHPPTKKKRRK